MFANNAFSDVAYAAYSVDTFASLAGVAATIAAGGVVARTQQKVRLTGTALQTYTGAINARTQQLVRVRGTGAVIHTGALHVTTQQLIRLVGNALRMQQGTPTVRIAYTVHFLGNAATLATGLIVPDAKAVIRVRGVSVAIHNGAFGIWQDIATGGSPEWINVIQDTLLLDNVDTFGGAPRGDIAISGGLRREITMAPDTWANIDTADGPAWQDVIT